MEVAYDRRGEGAPLVLVHGAGGDARIWEPQLEGLADDFTVIAWDEPGAGRSPDIPADFALTDFADSLAELIEPLGPAHVLGLSWGGTVVLEFYRRHPGLAQSLVLADTYAGWKGSLPPEEVQARVDGFRNLVDHSAPVPGLFAGAPPARYVPLLEEIAADIRPESMAVVLEVMAAADLSDVLPTIAVPTLLLWGELDARSPLSVARQFRQAIPGAELVVFPATGHVSNLEQPGAFNAAVRGFCRAVASGHVPQHPPAA